jgi:hypothetical protein
MLMKKGSSISLVLLTIVAMFHFSVATHYCSGTIAASKVSLSGKLASCGMEDSKKELPLSGTYFTRLCCEDETTFYGVDNSYTPSFSFLPEPFHYDLQVLYLSKSLSEIPGTDLIHFYTNASPPGAFMSTDVDISGICVFRI